MLNSTVNVENTVKPSDVDVLMNSTTAGHTIQTTTLAYSLIALTTASSSTERVTEEMGTSGTTVRQTESASDISTASSSILSSTWNDTDLATFAESYSRNQTVLSDQDIEEFLQRKNDEFTMLVLPAIIILCVLFVVGVLGNTLVLYVYNRKFKRGTIRWFIQALAVFDLLSCLVAVPGEIVDMRINYTFGLSPMCKVLRSVSMFCTVASGVTLIVVAVERYKRICTPLRRQILPREAQIIVGVCTIISAICAAPASVLYGKQTTPTDDPLINGSDCSTADTFINTVFPLAFGSFQCLLFLGGALVLVVLYTLIARKIWAHARFKKLGFSARANRRMSYIFTGSECSSPATDDVVFTFPYRRSGAGEVSSDSNNGVTDIGAVYDNNNTDPKFHTENGSAEMLKTGAESDGRDIDIVSAANTGPAGIPERDPVKVANGVDKVEDVVMRKKSYSRQTSAEKAALKTDGKLKSGDSLLRKTSFSKTKERHRSGDSTLRGRYQRRASVFTQPDVRRFINRSESVNSGNRRTTLMLFLITVVYVLSFLPYLILMVIKVLDDDSLSGRGDGWELAHNILLRSYFINSMANPIIYSFCSRTFRKETSKVLHCGCCKK